MTIGYLEDRIAKLELEIQNLQEEHEALVEGVRYLRNEIAKNQTVEAEPIRHGKWIDDKIAFYRQCTECGANVRANLYEVFLDCDIRDLHYCPNCGAKMDEVEE